MMTMLIILGINLTHEAIEGSGAVVGRFKTAAICHKLHHLDYHDDDDCHDCDCYDHFDEEKAPPG